MNYLTNYYRNLSEQLQQKLNLLNNILAEKTEESELKYISPPENTPPELTPKQMEFENSTKSSLPQPANPQVARELNRKINNFRKKTDIERGSVTQDKGTVGSAAEQGAIASNLAGTIVGGPVVAIPAAVVGAGVGAAMRATGLRDKYEDSLTPHMHLLQPAPDPSEYAKAAEEARNRRIRMYGKDQ